MRLGNGLPGQKIVNRCPEVDADAGARPTAGAIAKLNEKPVYVLTAGLYSLIEIAKVAGIEPYSYLRHLFTALPHATAVAHFEALPPWNIDRSLVASTDPAPAVIPAGD